jgi:hypothetical protein
MMQMTKPILAIALSALVFDVSAMGLGDVLGGLAGRSEYSGMSVDRALEKISARENRKLPQLIDDHTRLDKVTADTGQRFTYHYTMLNGLGVEQNKASFNDLLKPKLKNRACGSEDLKLFFNNGVTISYQYRTQDGHEIGRLDVTPSDCGRNV